MVLRLRLALRLPPVRAARAPGAQPAHPLSTGPVRGTAQGERSERAGRDRREAPVYVSLCRVAGARAWHQTQVSGGASFQPPAAAATGNRGRLPPRTAPPPFSVPP